MNQTQNSLSMPENQCVEGLRMMLQGMAMVFGTMAESIGGVPDFPTQTAGRTPENPVPPNGKVSEANASAVQEKPKAAQSAAASKKPTAATSPEQVASPKAAPGGKSITRTDVERAMAAKIKAMAAQGKGPGVIGQLFPKFHGAQCVSDLTAADYPAFLEELNQL